MQLKEKKKSAVQESFPDLQKVQFWRAALIRNC